MNIGADIFTLVSCGAMCPETLRVPAMPSSLPHLPLPWLFLHILRFCQGPEDPIGARDLSSLLVPCAHDGGESLPEACAPLWALLTSFENT